MGFGGNEFSDTCIVNSWNMTGGLANAVDWRVGAFMYSQTHLLPASDSTPPTPLQMWIPRAYTFVQLLLLVIPRSSTQPRTQNYPVSLNIRPRPPSPTPSSTPSLVHSFHTAPLLRLVSPPGLVVEPTARYTLILNKFQLERGHRE